MERFRRFEARWLLGWAVLTVFLPIKAWLSPTRAFLWTLSLARCLSQ
jgi:hypothetical protein